MRSLGGAKSENTTRKNGMECPVWKDWEEALHDQQYEGRVGTNILFPDWENRRCNHIMSLNALSVQVPQCNKERVLPS